ncbi:MAG TPA: hypothetical protein VGD37_31095, partial [Kofleriaceae bacterium]
EIEIVEALSEIGMPLLEPALAECATAALASLRARGLAAGPPEPAAAKPRKTKPRETKPRKPSPAKAKKSSPPRFRLTENGRVALGQAFELTAAPTWKDMCNRIVPALALGEPPGSEAATRALASAEAMIATLLRRDRTLGEVATVAELCDRIIARALGMPPGPVTPAWIRAYALAMHCGVSSKAELEEIAGRFPATRAPRKPKGTKGTKSEKGAKRATPEAALTSLGEQLADHQLGVESNVQATTEAASKAAKAAAKAALLRSLQRRWVSQQDESDDAQRPSTLRSSAGQPPRTAAEVAQGALIPSAAPDADAAETLLTAVREAIPMVGSDGRYGKENVFVSALWQQVACDARLSELSLDRFKSWLVTANRNQQLALARADMVDDMDARLVEASEIEDLGATFHFVLDRRDSPPAPWQVHHG